MENILLEINVDPIVAQSVCFLRENAKGNFTTNNKNFLTNFWAKDSIGGEILSRKKNYLSVEEINFTSNDPFVQRFFSALTAEETLDEIADNLTDNNDPRIKFVEKLHAAPSDLQNEQESQFLEAKKSIFLEILDAYSVPEKKTIKFLSPDVKKVRKLSETLSNNHKDLLEKLHLTFECIDSNLQDSSITPNATGAYSKENDDFAILFEKDVKSAKTHNLRSNCGIIFLFPGSVDEDSPRLWLDLKGTAPAVMVLNEEDMIETVWDYISMSFINRRINELRELFLFSGKFNSLTWNDVVLLATIGVNEDCVIVNATNNSVKEGKELIFPGCKFDYTQKNYTEIEESFSARGQNPGVSNHVIQENNIKLFFYWDGKQKQLVEAKSFPVQILGDGHIIIKSLSISNDNSGAHKFREGDAIEINVEIKVSGDKALEEVRCSIKKDGETDDVELKRISATTKVQILTEDFSPGKWTFSAQTTDSKFKKSIDYTVYPLANEILLGVALINEKSCHVIKESPKTNLGYAEDKRLERRVKAIYCQPQTQFEIRASGVNSEYDQVWNNECYYEFSGSQLPIQKLQNGYFAATAYGKTTMTLYCRNDRDPNKRIATYTLNFHVIKHSYSGLFLGLLATAGCALLAYGYPGMPLKAMIGYVAALLIFAILSRNIFYVAQNELQRLAFYLLRGSCYLLIWYAVIKEFLIQIF